MKAALIAAFLLVAASANAQNVWQMNAAIQGQYNRAYQGAWASRYYGGYGYGGGYVPRYYGGYGFSNAPVGSAAWLNQRQAVDALEDQAWELRKMNWAIERMELEQSFRRRPF